MPLVTPDTNPIVPKRKCVRCASWVTYIVKPDSTAYDETNRAWCKGHCPKCKSVKAKEISAYWDRLDSKHIAEHGITAEATPEQEALVYKPPKVRFCRKDRGGCGKKLEKDRYFLCVRCECKEVFDDLGDMHGLSGWDSF